MALSSGTKGFYYRGSLSGVHSSPVTMDIIIDDSATLTVGDAVVVDADGFIDVAGAGGPILGVLSAVVDKDGINVFETGRAGGTDGSTLTGDDTITVSSTNTSDATRNLKGRVILPVGHTKFYNDTDGSLAQANLFQYFDNDASGHQIATGGASDANGTWQLIEIDPDGDGDASKGIFIINECILGPQNVDTATAKIAA